MEHFNKLTPAQAERLALLAEECGETIQIIGKILRHGYDSYHPNGTGPNQRLLEVELGHVFAAVQMLEDSDDIERGNLLDEKHAKLGRVGRYLHHAQTSIPYATDDPR